MKKKIIICISLFVITLVVCIVFINTKYFVVINGEKVIDIPVFSEFHDEGAKTLVGGFKLEIYSSVDTSKVGTYQIKYCFSKCNTKTVNVVDLEAPVITLKGDNPLNMSLGQTYQEIGYEVTDNYDKLDDKVIVSDDIDTSVAGTYHVNYKVVDSSGNEGSVTREIIVNEKGPLTMNKEEFSLDGYFVDAILKETEPVDDDYIKETVFFGDSFTFNFAYYGAIPFSNNIWAKSSITPETALTNPINIKWTETDKTYGQILSEYKPKRIVITLGANAMTWMETSYFVEQYRLIIEKTKEISPNTLVIIQSVLPFDSSYDTKKNINDKINKTNYYLAELCQKEGVKFLNSAGVMKDETGACKKGYCYQSDGIHPTKEANMLVIDYLKRHAYYGNED